MELEEIRKHISIHTKLCGDIINRVKERKTKIRKFMLFVNNSLNETENEMTHLQMVLMQMEHSLRENDKLIVEAPESQKKSKLMTFSSQADSVDEHEETAPDTVPHHTSTQYPIKDGVFLSAAEESILGNEATEHASNSSLVDKQSSSQLKAVELASYDETVGIFPVATQNDSAELEKQDESAHSEMEWRVPSKPNPPNTTDTQNYILTPVSNLLSDVLSTVSTNNSSISSGSNNRPTKLPHHKKSTEKRSTLKSEKCSSQSHPVAPKPTLVQAISSKKDSHRMKKVESINLTESPCLFSEDERKEECLILAVDTDDEKYGAKSSDVTVTKVKKKPVWPIGYPKPGASGELIVEPSDNKPRKRARQTRLDGYLSKASSFNQSNSDQVSLIALNSMKNTEKRTATNMHDLQANSDSDEQLGIELNLLHSKSRTQNVDSSCISNRSDTSFPSTSTSNVNPRRLKDEAEIYPEKKSKYEVGQVVRGKARKDLTGYRCKTCYQYYKTLNLTEEQIQKRLDEVCRHRAVKPPMETPPQFWNMTLMSSLDNSPG